LASLLLLLPGIDVAAEEEVPESTWMETLRQATDAMEWTDDRISHGWRIQRKPGDEACRVLDPRDACVFEGTHAACLDTFAKLTDKGTIPEVSGPTVILLHGLGEGRGSMQPLAAHLQKTQAATVLSFGYASPRTGIDDHARSLGRVIEGLPHARPISFVGHSLGNLVVRRWMALADERDRGRLNRMVMLGAPNQGSELARMASRVWVLAALSNGAARELVVDWPAVAPTLAVPTCPFGIIAGGKGDDRGFSTLLEGDDDAIVKVTETQLEGSSDFLLVPVRHSLMMKDPTVQRATESFLAHGHFLVPEQAPDQRAAPAQ
jgi:pimeloyl-ACP methyl ester carboxylesterase